MTDRESVLRFDLAMQKSHALVYTAAFITAVAGTALGVFTLKLGVAVGARLGARARAAAVYALFARGGDRKGVNPLWIALDIPLLTLRRPPPRGLSHPL